MNLELFFFLTTIKRISTYFAKHEKSFEVFSYWECQSPTRTINYNSKFKILKYRLSSRGVNYIEYCQQCRRFGSI